LPSIGEARRDDVAEGAEVLAGHERRAVRVDVVLGDRQPGGGERERGGRGVVDGRLELVGVVTVQVGAVRGADAVAELAQPALEQRPDLAGEAARVARG
jgi:hypothetical protein